jgi:uncharacterized membrane protein
MTTTENQKSTLFRDIPVDVLRGLAIAIMVGANLVPFLLLPPAPSWLRFVSSLAAPLFIFLSGMMVALSCRMKHHTFSYFLVRGGFVILVAALLDLVVGGVVPFIDMDVLYLIGISLPLAYLFLSLSLRARAGVVLIILAATPLLQAWAGYIPLPLAIPLTVLQGGGMFPAVPAIAGQWFIDGWFPLFPWLAISLLGAQAGSFRWQQGGIIPFARRDIAALAGTTLVLGAVLWSLFPGPMLTRFGFIEVFYPPALAFILLVTGIIFCLFVLADCLPLGMPVFDPLRALGECSLAIYILHTIVIDVLIAPLGVQISLDRFFCGYLIFIGAMIFVAYAIRQYRQGTRSSSFVVRVLIGG